MDLPSKFRRMKAVYADYNEILREIENNEQLNNVLSGLAIDQMTKTIYINLKEQKDWKGFWQSITGLSNPQHWRSHEKVKDLAGKINLSLLSKTMMSMKTKKFYHF